MGRAGGQLRHATLKIWQKLFTHRRSVPWAFLGRMQSWEARRRGDAQLSVTRCTTLERVCCTWTD